MALSRRLRPWDMFEEFNRMRRDLESLMGQAWESTRGAGSRFFGERALPAMNLYEAGDDFLVTAEIPGVKIENVQITVTGDCLTVKGTRESEIDCEQVNCHRLERETGPFSRTLTLPANVAADKVEATYVDGVLQVRLPKAEEAKPRVIKVSS